MSKFLTYLTVAILSLCFVASAVADWSIYRQVQLRNVDKNYLRFSGPPEGPVYAWLLFGRKIPGVFKSKYPLYQVDGNEVSNLKAAQKVQTDKNKENWVRWQIYDGKGGISDELKEFMHGKEAVFQYYYPSGMIKETTFDLTGAKEAIEGVLRK